MKKRDLYLNELLKFKNKNIIKVITGIRRCGKSSLLKLFRNHLIDIGVEEKNIIFINFESMVYDFIDDYKKLNSYIKEKIVLDKKNYILLDEVQLVEKWEKTVNSLLVDYDVDIYVTGSNAYLLSSELSTLLSGRYIEIKMTTLSFKEFIQFHEFSEEESKEEIFSLYLKYGGFPSVADLGMNQEIVNSFLEGVYNTVILKDVIQRNSIKDVSLLENIFKFITQNIGSIVSPRSISNTINSEGRKTTSETIDNYLSMLQNAFIIHQIKRYDIKGKQILKTLGKYYISDIGIRNAVLGYRDIDFGHILENVVYLELIRRKYNVYIGKIGEYEVDFIAEKQDDKKYYQVTLSLNSDEVIERENRPLLLIDDNYEKIIISKDKNFVKDSNGIKYINIINFLLEE
ncbi:MAG: ATP-binding protein [Fusobacteriaceae bacterium]